MREGWRPGARACRIHCGAGGRGTAGRARERPGVEAAAEEGSGGRGGRGTVVRVGRESVEDEGEAMG